MAPNRTTCWIVLVAASGGSASGQAVPVAPPPIVQPTLTVPVPPIASGSSEARFGENGRLLLTPVDQGVTDLDTLATSLRKVDQGVQVPQGFDSLYLVPGRSDLFMRVDGGLYAVFPQSVYANLKGKISPVVPANTVFYIGQGSIESLSTSPQPKGDHVGEGRIDSRIDSLIKPIMRTSAPVLAEERRVPTSFGPAPAKSIGARVTPIASGPLSAGTASTPLKDSRLRAERVRALLLRAALAESSSMPGAPASRPEQSESSVRKDAGTADPESPSRP